MYGENRKKIVIVSAKKNTGLKIKEIIFFPLVLKSISKRLKKGIIKKDKAVVFAAIPNPEVTARAASKKDRGFS